jgi:hypothetical protein
MPFAKMIFLLDLELLNTSTNHITTSLFGLIKTQRYDDTRVPHVRMLTRFLHPYDVALAKDIMEIPLDLNCKLQAGFENFIRSKQLDQFCVNGKFYIA